MKVKIAVVGNCQSRPIASLLENAFLNVEIISIAVVHLLKSDQVEEYLPLFEQADFIITQYISDEYPCDFVRTAFLGNLFGSKLIKIHNLFYKGYTPELRYLRLQGKGTLRGPLGDYHNELIFDGWEQDKNKSEIIRDLKSESLWLSRYASVHKESISELKAREKALDIDMADNISESLKDSRLFFTFNHPSKYLLKMLVSKIAILMTLKENSSFNIETMREPLNQFNVPISQFVHNQLSLKFDDKNIKHKGVAKDDKGDFKIPRAYSTDELIDTFFEVYNDNKELILQALIKK